MTRKARIAHLAGPNATIQNTPPLVTSNKARAKHNLAPLTTPDGTRFYPLRQARLDCPAPADATSRAQRASGRPRRARPHRGLRALARPLLHRRLGAFPDQGPPNPEGLAGGIMQCSARGRPRAAPPP